jgi:hypothetical protein
VQNFTPMEASGLPPTTGRLLAAAA